MKTTSASLLFACLAACMSSNAPPAPTPDEVAHYLMSQRLPSGGAEILAPQPVGDSPTDASTKLTLTYAQTDLADGGAIVTIAGGFGANGSGTPPPGAAYVSAEAETTVLAPGAMVGGDSGYIGLATHDGALVTACASQAGVLHNTTALAWQTASHSAIPVSLGSRVFYCTDVSTPTANGFAVLSAGAGGGATITEYSVSAGSVVAGTTTSLPMSAGDPALLVVKGAGYAWVEAGGNALTYGETGTGTTFTLSVDGPYLPTVRAESSGALLVIGDTIARWHVESDGHSESLSTSPAAPEGTGWQPWGPQYQGVAIAARVVTPTDTASTPYNAEYRVRQAVGAAYSVWMPPASPCIDDEACLEVGQSYLLGIVGGEGTGAAVYSMWTWLGPTGVYVRPVSE